MFVYLFILVVFSYQIDDGVRPQTVEAVKTALEAGSRVIIAVNKADKIPEANRETAVTRVLTQLLDVGLVAEQFGGDVQAVLVAGKTGEGLPALIESIILQAEIMDLKAANVGLAEGGEICQLS
jgi:translation initiation factor IF-2